MFTMTQDLLSRLHGRGIKLRLVDDQLEVVAPAGTLTPELRDELRRERDGLIGLLRRSEPSEQPAVLVPRPELRYEPFPLTDIQHAYWVGRNSVVELGGVSSHFYFELEREGLDEERLQDSLRKVIARHDMLRAIFQTDGEQRILAEVPPYGIAVADLRELDEAERTAAIERIRGEMDHHVLPADRWPLFEIRMSRMDSERLRLHVSLDVLILDAFSLYLLFLDWRRFYLEPGWVPEPLELSYRDHVLAEAAQIGGARYARAEEYWLGRLDELPPAPALPLAIQPAQLPASRFTRRRANLPHDRWAAMKEFAQRRGLTPSTVLMTAFADTLRRWAAQPSVTLNLTLFNRPSSHPQIGQLIGDFTSVTLLASHAGAGEPFTERARTVQAQFMADLEHLAYSGVRVMRQRGRRLGGGPAASMPIVFTSAIGLTSADDPADGMRFFGDFGYGISQTPQVWLDHQAMEEQGELYYNWDAVEALFPAGLLDDIFAAYGDLLDRLSRDERAWEDALPAVSPPAWQIEEREKANDTAAQIPARTLCDLVEDQARKNPYSAAVRCGDELASYHEVAARGRRMARRLRDLGAATDTLIAVVMDRSVDQVAAVLGVNRSGAAYLPIDPQWPEARRRQLLEQGRVRVVVTSPRLRDELAWPDGQQLVTFADPEVRDASADPLDGGPGPDDLAYVIFTSGSTGQPKGVMIDHRGAANTIQDINARFEIGPGDRVLALSALSFDLSVYDIFGTLAAGGTIVMPPPAATPDPVSWNDLVERHGVTIWNSVPALMQAWLDAHPPNRLPPGLRLRLVLLSGDWIPVDMPDAIRAHYPAAQVISLGGATEASIWSVLYPIGSVPAEWTRIPYGKPMANQTLHVYDDQLASSPVWTTGEIYIGGVGVAQGYWSDPERTAERFIVHPGTHERLYRTGDLGRYLPGGDIEFLGREDFQVKLNGYRIELGEISAALRRQPGVGEALVTVATNPQTGRRQLAAYVTPAAGQDGPEPDGAESTRWRDAVDAGRAALSDGIAGHEEQLAVYQDTWRATETISPTVMARTLARLGVFTIAGDTATADDVVRQCELTPRYRRLIDRWMSTLASYGLLQPTGRPGEYRCPQGFDADWLDDEVRVALAALDQLTGADRVLVDYFTSCADRQVEILRGEVNPLELLLPGGSHQVTDALYADNPVSRVQNQVAARVIRAIVDQAPAGDPVRILEVGAGTGATSDQVLAELPADRIRYRFTDISTYFVDRARQRYGEHPAVDFAVLDVDGDPAVQGFEPASADIIVAANVMHDARDLGQSLRRLRSVLAPGGILVLIEATVNTPQQLVTIGFIEGFARHEGQRDLPLLSVEEWRQHLAAAGFPRCTAVPGADPAAEVIDQQVIVAEALADEGRLDTDALRAGLGELLPDYMVPHRYLVLDRLPLSANGKVDPSALPPPWDSTVANERISPRNAAEQQLFDIWREALGRDDFGVEDNFFELGGDSLHAVRMLGRLRTDLGMQENAEEGLQALFDNPTIAELAKTLHGLGEA
jgi:amino acid adenylation domain-containing protein